MKNKFLLGLLGLSFMVIPCVNASDITGSWATKNEGVLKIENSNPTGRYKIENSLYEADTPANTFSDETFTGVGHFNSITFYFHALDENKVMTHYGKLVNNPDGSVPDLRLTEVTWGNDNSDWSAEGVEIWAVNYNGTGEDKLIAYAYNKVAQKRASDYVNEEYPNGYTLPSVEGTKIEYVFADADSEARNLYDTLVYFNDEFENCDAIRLVDITEDLKFLGGGGQTATDGYDLDAIYGYRVLLTSVVQDVTYVSENSIEVTSDNSVVYNDLETYSDYTVLSNMFEKEGYEFVAWSTDGSGNIYGDLTKEDIPNYNTEYDYYAPGYVINLDDSYTFYGVWKEIVIEEEPDEDDKPTCGNKDHNDKHDGKHNCSNKEHNDKHDGKHNCGNVSVKPNNKPNCGNVSVKPNNKPNYGNVSVKPNNKPNCGNVSVKPNNKPNYGNVSVKPNNKPNYGNISNISHKNHSNKNFGNCSCK